MTITRIHLASEDNVFAGNFQQAVLKLKYMEAKMQINKMTPKILKIPIKIVSSKIFGEALSIHIVKRPILHKNPPKSVIMKNPKASSPHFSEIEAECFATKTFPLSSWIGSIRTSLSRYLQICQIIITPATNQMMARQFPQYQAKKQIVKLTAKAIPMPLSSNAKKFFIILLIELIIQKFA